MLPAISQACTMSSAFGDDLAGYSDAAASALEVWLTKLEEYLRDHSLDEVRTLAADKGLALAAAAYQGGLLVAQGDARRAAWEQFQSRLALCGALAIPTLVVVPDFLAPFDQLAIDRAQISLRQAGEAAAQHGVRLAVEFQARNTFLNNLETTASFVQSVGHPAVGICFDVFHYYAGPSKFEDLRFLTPANLFHVQFCDIADTPREMATDADRILPGDGDFELESIVARFRQIGYTGYVWLVPARQLGEIGLTALRKVLGQTQPPPA